MASSSQRIPMAQSVDQSFQHVSLSCASDPLPPISSTPGNLVAVWATVSDFVGVSIKERTWWHLRHLQQSLMPGSARSKGQEGDADEDAGESISDGGMIRLAHCVVGKWSSHAHRKSKARIYNGGDNFMLVLKLFTLFILPGLSCPIAADKSAGLVRRGLECFQRWLANRDDARH